MPTAADIACACGVKALAAKQPGGSAEQLAAAIAVVTLFLGLARTPARALGRRVQGRAGFVTAWQGKGVHCLAVDRTLLIAILSAIVRNKPCSSPHDY